MVSYNCAPDMPLPPRLSPSPRISVAAVGLSTLKLQSRPGCSRDIQAALPQRWVDAVERPTNAPDDSIAVARYRVLVAMVLRRPDAGICSDRLQHEDPAGECTWISSAWG